MTWKTALWWWFGISAYIYHCYGGSHSSVVAAAVHVGLLTEENVSAQAILSLPYYDTQKAGDHGFLQFLGTDNRGNRVFSVGLESGGPEVVNACRNLLALAHAGENIHFVATLSSVNWWMKAGGFISRFLGFKAIGRPLVVFGTARAMPDIIKLVTAAKSGG